MHDDTATQAGPAGPGVQPALPFDLRGAVRDVLEHTDAADYALIASMVADRVPAAARDAALRDALTAVVAQESSLSRVRTHAAARAAPAGGSAKVAAIRAAMVAARLRENIYTGDGEARRKFLADCTAADLDKAVERRRAQAAHCLLVAEEYQRIRDALAAHPHARTVSELPPIVLAALLGGEPAGVPGVRGVRG